MPAGVEFEAPLWLAAIPALAVVLVLARVEWWRAALEQRPCRLFGQELRRLAVRLVWCSLVVLALAGLTVVRALDRQASVLVLDTSASTTTVRDQLENAARAGAAALPRGDLLGVVATADGASVEEAPTERPVFVHLST